MAKLRKIEGIVPAACVVYTDETCRTIDEDVYRQHLRYLLKHDIGALVVGGHMGENPCLTREERKRILKIAQEEVKGKIPVVGGISSESTREAVEQGLEAKEWGADALLFPPPNMPGWDMITSGQMMVEHYANFDRKVDIPIILYGSPNAGGTFGILPQTFREIAQRVENVVALKILAGWNTGVFKACCRAMKSVRDIGCLQAGSSNLVGAFMAGGDGTLSGSANFLVEQEVQVLKAVKAGDYVKAKEIADNYEPICDLLFGYSAGLPISYFHYRFKVGTWLMGLIPRPHMRLPQLPIPKKEVEMIRQAMIKAGLPVVHQAEDFALSDI